MQTRFARIPVKQSRLTSPLISYRVCCGSIFFLLWIIGKFDPYNPKDPWRRTEHARQKRAYEGRAIKFESTNDEYTNSLSFSTWTVAVTYAKTLWSHFSWEKFSISKVSLHASFPARGYSLKASPGFEYLVLGNLTSLARKVLFSDHFVRFASSER